MPSIILTAAHRGRGDPGGEGREKGSRRAKVWSSSRLCSIPLDKERLQEIPGSSDKQTAPGTSRCYRSPGARASASPEGLVKTQTTGPRCRRSGLVGLRWSPRFCICNRVLQAWRWQGCGSPVFYLFADSPAEPCAPLGLFSN